MSDRDSMYSTLENVDHFLSQTREKIKKLEKCNPPDTCRSCNIANQVSERLEYIQEFVWKANREIFDLLPLGSKEEYKKKTTFTPERDTLPLI